MTTDSKTSSLIFVSLLTGAEYRSGLHDILPDECAGAGELSQPAFQLDSAGDNDSMALDDDSAASGKNEKEEELCRRVPASFNRYRHAARRLKKKNE